VDIDVRPRMPTRQRFVIVGYKRQLYNIRITGKHPTIHHSYRSSVCDARKLGQFTIAAKTHHQRHKVRNCRTR
jgi:hypothetical protein